MSNAIIIPTFNEKDNIERIIKEVLSTNTDFKILIIDDSSFDGTGEIIDNLFKKYPDKIKVTHRGGARGLGRSYIEGFKYLFSKYNDFQHVITMDADLSHDPKYLPELLEGAKNYDVVIGSRYIKGISVVNWSLGRLILSISANWFVRRVLNLPIKDTTSGFVCYRKEAINSIDLNKIKSDSYAFQIEMKYKLYKKGFKFKEIPIIFAERKYGKSKLGKKELFKTIFAVLNMRIFGG